MKQPRHEPRDKPPPLLQRLAGQHAHPAQGRGGCDQQGTPPPAPVSRAAPTIGMSPLRTLYASSAIGAIMCLELRFQYGV